MQVALNQIRKRCLAWKTEKAEGPFSCPECLGAAILKKGKVREHHFAHVPPFDCHYGTGESQIHYKCKREIYEALSSHPKCSVCEIEKRLDGVRPDVFAVVSNNKIAIEVQKSNITTDDINRRSVVYSKLGIYVLWLVPIDTPKSKWHDGEEEYVCRPREWEKYLHAMYFGRVYYWNEGLFVSPYHFNKFQIYVEERDWYDEYGDEQYAGGYYKDAKALKLPVQYPRKNLNIIEDFSPKKRPKFDSSNWYIPSCNIWMDSMKAWWKKSK